MASGPGRFLQRLLLLAAAVPFFYALLFLLPHAGFLAFNVATVAAALGGALEVEGLARRVGAAPPRLAFSLLSASLPLAAYLEGARILPQGFFHPWFLVTAAAALLTAPAARREGQLRGSLARAAASLLVLIYPGLLLSYVVRLTVLPETSLVLLLFFAMIFLNDIMAYVAGMTLGRSTRLGLAVSPNKSAAGFTAGLAASVGAAALFRALAPRVLPVSWAVTVLLGAGLGVLAVLGDLVESALKRAAGVKDSSAVIPGRGGLMDSLDSLLLCAPAYYFVMAGILD